MHWGSGNIAFAREAAAAFHPGRPVFGFEAVGLWREARPLLSVGDMAERYLREIKEIQPRGPYLIGGLCSGSQIAYEIACRLAESGAEVGPLTLVNAARGELSAGPLLDLEDLYDLRLAALRRQFAVADLAVDLPYVMDAMRSLRWIDDDMPAGHFFWRQLVSAADAYAFTRCELRRYEGPVNVFVSRAVATEPEVRWQDIAPQSVIEALDAETSVDILTHPGFVNAMRRTSEAVA
ncbi:thioesterase domain-containing protein [Nonomuraea solani]|uniref:thioesterase domain-containing protein n=1 Tax=Nonomuraea solani TaxID=1144553 RepID=UPI001358CF34|nr:thioesterase domain-containing protein [Nonomuraea solani]